VPNAAIIHHTIKKPLDRESRCCNLNEIVVAMFFKVSKRMIHKLLYLVGYISNKMHGSNCAFIQQYKQSIAVLFLMLAQIIFY
jgi:hypothetical protein